MTNAEIAQQLAAAPKLLDVDALLVPARRRRSPSAWSDVFPLGDRSFVISVGNVADGGDATTLMHALRETVHPHSAAVVPRAVLRAADELIRGATAGPECATAIVGVFDSARGTFTYVSAGHPPPFVRYADGTVSALPADGLPLGPSERGFAAAHVEVDLTDGLLLVLYSSMLVQATNDPDDGIRRLRDVLADERLAGCPAPAAWIARRMLGDDGADDVALLAIGFPKRRNESGVTSPGDKPRWTVSWSFDSTVAASTGARRAFLHCLSAKGGGANLDLAAAELIFGELLGNVVRHAPGPVEVVLDWTDVLPVLHVLDNGPGFASRRKRERLPDDDLSESGRGLFIVNACAVDFSLNARGDSGTHARVTLPPA